jgi:hypothetical protein
MDPQRLFGPITTRTVRISQFDTFFLHNIPYAEVPPEDVNWGALEYDGPLADGIEGAKPALQWHFGGIPYPISKAIKINYTYVRRWDGSNDRITTSIYLGFQHALDECVLDHAIPFVSAPTPTFIERVKALGTYGGLSTYSWGSDAGVLASESQAVVTRSFAFDAVNLQTFNLLMHEELSEPVYHELLRDPLPLDLDGPAQDYDSHRPFEYTFATLQNEPEKYSQLLFWYFGGRPFRITKAMRLPLGRRPAGGSFVQAAAEARTAALKSLKEARKTASGLTRELAHEADKEAPAAKQKQEQLAEAQAQVDAQRGELRQIPTQPGSESLFVGFSGPDPSG